LQGNGSATLYAVAAEGYSDGPIILANLTGTHYEVGYMFATLMPNEAIENYNALIADITSDALLQGILGVFMDWQYSSYLVHGLSQDFLDELQGVADAAAAMQNTSVSQAMFRALVRTSCRCCFNFLLRKSCACGWAASLPTQFLGLLTFLHPQNLAGAPEAG
jgi:hypothetical protein